MKKSGTVCLATWGTTYLLLQSFETSHEDHQLDTTRGLSWLEGFTEKSSQVGMVVAEQMHTG